MITDNFIKRHNGPREEEVEMMLKKIGVSSLDELIEKTVPNQIVSDISRRVSSFRTALT